MAERELAIVVSGKDFATRVIRGVKGELKGLDKIASRGIGTAIGNLERMALVAGGAAVVGLGYAVKAAGTFEAQLNTINTVAQVTPEKLKAIGQSIRQLSRETGVSTDDLTSGYYDLVSAGISATDAQDVLNQSVKLGIGGLGTTGEAIDLLTTAINAYGGDASKAGLYADYFAQAVAAGKVTIADIASTFATAAPLAANMGVGVDELAAAIGVMTAKGETGASSLTATNAAMLALLRTTPALEKLQKDLGVNFAQMAGEKGLAYTWQVIAAGAAKAKKPLIDYTGRAEALAFVLDTSGVNAENYATQLDLVRKAHDGEGVAAEQAAERQQGFNFQMARLKANVNDAAITIGDALLPALADLADKGVAWITTHQADIAKFADDLAKGFQGAVTWAGKLDWTAIGSTLGTLRDVAHSILDAFLGMPSWVQVAVVSGWGLNKLTGGALGQIVGALATGLIKGILGINAGVVNINAGVVNGGAGGLGAAGGLAAAKQFLPTGLMGWLGFLGIAAADFALISTAVSVFQDQQHNVGIASDFEKGVVAGRNDRAVNPHTDRVALREDLRHEIAAGGGAAGDPLRYVKDVLKWAFVDPELRDQMAQVNRSIMEEAVHLQRGDDAVRAELSTIGIEDAMTNRLLAEHQAVRNADAAKSLDLLRSQLTGINQLHNQPITVNTYPSFTANVQVNYNSRLAQAAIMRIRLAQGGGGTGGSL